MYHASRQTVREPQWDYFSPNKPLRLKGRKDFGLGFYTCTEPDYPIYLYSAEDTIILNEYELYLDEPKVLKRLRLKSDTIWLLIIAAHRRDFSDFKEWLPIRDRIRNYIAEYDLLIGDISNDRFFSAFERFLANNYTDEFTLRLAKRLSYPEQYVLKSDDACKQIKYVRHETVHIERIDQYRLKKINDNSTVKTWVEEIEREAKADRTFYLGKKFDDIVREMNENDWFKNGS